MPAWTCGITRIEDAPARLGPQRLHSNGLFGEPERLVGIPVEEGTKGALAEFLEPRSVLK
jgi:hypothetical protein